MGLKARAAPGLPKSVRESLPDYVALILDNLRDSDLAEGNFEAATEDDSDEVNYGFAIGYVSACADVAGMSFNKFVQQIAVEQEMIEQDDG